MRISEKVIEILKAINAINPGVILREDYLYSKVEANNEEIKVKKGSEDIVINYEIPEGDIDLDGKEIGIMDINNFLGVIKTYNNKTLDIGLNGLAVTLKDDRKRGKYMSQTTSILPVKNKIGEELYSSGEKVISMLLSQDEKELILKDLSSISPDSLEMVSEDGNIYLLASNETTGNDVKIKIKDSNVYIANDNIVFPNPNIINLLINDDFNINVVKTEYNSTSIKIVKFEAVGVVGLSYVLIHVEQ